MCSSWPSLSLFQGLEPTFFPLTCPFQNHDCTHTFITPRLCMHCRVSGGSTAGRIWADRTLWSALINATQLQMALLSELSWGISVGPVALGSGSASAALPNWIVLQDKHLYALLRCSECFWKNHCHVVASREALLIYEAGDVITSGPYATQELLGGQTHQPWVFISNANGRCRDLGDLSNFADIESESWDSWFRSILAMRNEEKNST